MLLDHTQNVSSHSIPNKMVPLICQKLALSIPQTKKTIPTYHHALLSILIMIHKISASNPVIHIGDNTQIQLQSIRPVIFNRINPTCNKSIAVIPYLTLHHPHFLIRYILPVFLGVFPRSSAFHPAFILYNSAAEDIPVSLDSSANVYSFPL